MSDNTEGLPIENWDVGPNDDHSWVRVAALIVAIVLLAGAFHIAQRWWSPAPPVVRINAPGGEQFALFYFPADNGFWVHSIYVVGDMDYRRLIAEHGVPPRCRNVPEGAGCIDWLEPGEKDWNSVLKNRGRQINAAHAEQPK